MSSINQPQTKVFNRNILVLFVNYAISWCVIAIAFTATASVGHQLASHKSWVLMPLIMQILGAVIMTVPAAKIMSYYGRRIGFMFGSLIGVVGALMCAYSIYLQNFWLLVCCTPLLGMYNGFGELVRFAAAEVYTDEQQKSRAIAVVMSGGIVSAFIGPAIADGSNQYFTYIAPYFGPYLAAFVLCFISMCCYFLLKDLPAAKPEVQNKSQSTEGKAGVLSNPIFLVATSIAAIGYLVMAAMMDAMPITMLEHGHGFSDTAVVLQWHLLAMFAPSYLTARLIGKFGVSWVICGGIFLNAVGIAVAIQGVQLHHFWSGLLLVGLGWNLMYVSGTHLLSRVPAMIRTQAEGLNNLAIMSSFAVSTPLTAFILAWFGYTTLAYFALALLIVALIMQISYRSYLMNSAANSIDGT